MGRSRSLIRSLRTDMRRPLPAFGYVLQYRKLDQGLGTVRPDCAAFKKLEYFIDALTPGCANHRNRRAQITGQRRGIQIPAPAAQIVCHIQHDKRGKPELQYRSGKNQVPMKIGGIQNQQYRVRPSDTRHLSREYVMRYLLVLRARTQAVDTGKIDENNIAAGNLGATNVLFDRDTGKIGDFLAESCESIEESRLAGVWRTYKGNGVGSGPMSVGAGRRIKTGCSRATVTIAHTFTSSRAIALQSPGAERPPSRPHETREDHHQARSGPP
jgi:hypothetical protein